MSTNTDTDIDTDTIHSNTNDDVLPSDEVGENVFWAQDEGNIYITIPKTGDLGPSQSGKTHCVATTHQMQYIQVTVEGHIEKWSLNCGLWRPTPRHKG